jgi:hypothetical protein
MLIIRDRGFRTFMALLFFWRAHPRRARQDLGRLRTLQSQEPGTRIGVHLRSTSLMPTSNGRSDPSDRVLPQRMWWKGLYHRLNAGKRKMYGTCMTNFMRCSLKAKCIVRRDQLGLRRRSRPKQRSASAAMLRTADHSKTQAACPSIAEG